MPFHSPPLTDEMPRRHQWKECRDAGDVIDVVLAVIGRPPHGRSRSQEFILLGALLRPKGPKFEAEAWSGFREETASPYHQLGVCVSVVSSTARFGAKPDRKYIFRRTDCPKTGLHLIMT